MSKLDANTILPASWNFVPLKELGDWSGGGTPSKAKPQYWHGGTIPWVSPKDMKTERISDSEDHITKEAVSHSATSLINAGSVLIVTRSGILRHTLPVAVNSVPVTVNQDLKALTPRNGIMAEYVAWALRAFSRDILHTCSKQGTTVNSVETSKLLGFEIPVAPRDQQAKIVSEIEKQFSRLDQAVANLKRVKANLKRYKASVLKAAVEGKLTEDWRKLHPNTEPASKLLERILAERRAKWNGRGKYKEPAEMDASTRTCLPDGWLWASIESLSAKVVDGVHKKPNYVSSGVPFVTVRNLTAGPGIDLGKLNFVTKEDHEQFIKRADPREGDILISKDGTLGVVRVIRTKAIFSIFVSVALVKPVLKEMSDYLGIALSSPQVQVQMVPKGSGLQHIHLEDLREDCVPVPTLDEQRKIVSQVERRLSVIEELEAAVHANLTRADRLRQSILATAFAGKLVKINPAKMMRGGY